MFKTDYHTHTPLCKHAEGTPQAFVEAALAAGLSHYGISDHAPMPHEPFDNWRMMQSDIPSYFDFISEAKALAIGTPLTVFAGLECDWVPGITPWISHLRSLYPWDYLIGSVHYINENWDFDNPETISVWAHTPVENAWEQYWNLYTEMVQSRLFDIMGHADIIRKFGHRPPGDLSVYYIPAIEAMAETGAILEINTAGWHKLCQEQYPSLEFLTLARQASIPLLINSDAHSPTELARDYARGLDLAKEAGYTELTRRSADGCHWESYPMPHAEG